MLDDFRGNKEDKRSRLFDVDSPAEIMLPSFQQLDTRGGSAGSSSKKVQLISIVNQKGGCGKTTTAINLAACIALKGKTVLLIDTDPQGQSSSSLGINTDTHAYSLYHVFIGDVPLKQIIVSSGIKNLYVAVSNLTLATAELELASYHQKEFILKEAIDAFLREYHFNYIIFDCSPTLNLVTLNVLTSTRYILIPVQTHFLSLEGMRRLFDTFDLVKKHFNASLRVLGILGTFVTNNELAQKILLQMRDYFEELVFDTVIHVDDKLAEAPIYGQPIVCLDGHSESSKEYQQLAQEVMSRINFVSLMER